jgi:hypothetical protein
VTQPLYLSYFADEGHRWGLSVHLEQDRFALQPHEWLRDLHLAADLWRATNPEVFLRSELGIEPEPGCKRVHLPAYLFGSGAVNGSRLGRHLTTIRTSGHIHRFTVRPGSPVEGADLVGRKGRITDLLRILDTGSAHLRAPRRYGKTSLLRHIEKQLSATGRPCLLTDLSTSHTVVGFLVTLARAAMDSSSCRAAVASLPELAGWPAREASPVEKSGAFDRLRDRIGSNPWSFGRRLLEALGESGGIVLLDEFSVFLRRAHAQTPEEARHLADLLAASRRSGSPTRQVFAGSAGLTSYIHFHGLEESFGGLIPLDLPPLAASEAAMLVEELLYGEGRMPSPEVTARIEATIGEPIPYFLHTVVNAVLQENSDGPVTPAEVDRAYSERVLGTSGNDLFKVYSLRSQPYPPELLRASARLLQELADRPEGVEATELRRIFGRTSSAPDEDRFEPLLSCLQEDYDLVEREDRWLMRCKVLRDRWALRVPWLTRVD